ncbi:MAG: putative polysaccharide biosynthesis protein [Halanaerobiaceae bacterium]
MQNNKNSSFIKGAVTLGTAGLISKILGFAAKIILPRLIGDVGVGIYEKAYPFYSILLVFSTAGLPIALAKLISERTAKGQYRYAYRIFRVCLWLSIITGLLLSVAMMGLAKPLIRLFGWKMETLYSILAITPAVFFVSIMATYRGFFQGLQNMVPTAISQVTEQFIRIVTIIVLVYILIPYGVEYGAAGATFGAVTGSIAGLLILLIIYRKKREKIWKFKDTTPAEKFNSLKIARKILFLAGPITFGALITPLMRFIDSAIVPARLEAGNFSSPTGLFGQFGMAMTLVRFPTILTLSLATALVPAISGAFARKDQAQIKHRTESSLRLTILLSLPAAAGLFILARPLTAVIFGSPESAIPLRFVAAGVLFISLKQISGAILQGMGKPLIPARNLLIGAVFNAVINYTLTALPQFGIRGAAVGTVTGFAIGAFLNLYYAKRWTNFSFGPVSMLLKPLLAAVIMSAAVYRGFNVVFAFFSLFVGAYSYAAATFSIVIIGALLYLVLLLLLNEIKYGDLVLIPRFGKKIADILLKWGFVEK